ncbi:hypothetical protein HDU87_005527 [Geranomyces variabilis]|uniref:SprT-like domain-containing protein n=1 Tax=Geranomyces variabilis TaxID=109894 RepID=A0AAD5TM98_9FUNG|nr:hypothetical protein HDU87_005527 [Geranomyces variabilis]
MLAAGLLGSTPSSALTALLQSGSPDPHTWHDLLALVPPLEREIEKRHRSLYPFEDPYQFLDPGFFEGGENDAGGVGIAGASALRSDEDSEGGNNDEGVAGDYYNDDHDDDNESTLPREESPHLDVVAMGELHVYEANDAYGLCEGESIQIYVPDSPTWGDAAVDASVELLPYPHAGGVDERQPVAGGGEESIDIPRLLSAGGDNDSAQYHQQHEDARAMFASANALLQLPCPDAARDDDGDVDEEVDEDNNDPSEYFSCSDDDKDIAALTTTIIMPPLPPLPPLPTHARRRSLQTLSNNSSPRDRHSLRPALTTPPPPPPRDDENVSSGGNAASGSSFHCVNVVAGGHTTDAPADGVTSTTATSRDAAPYAPPAAFALTPNDGKDDDPWSDSSAETLMPRTAAPATPAAAVATAKTLTPATPDQLRHPTDAHDRLFEHITLRKKKMRDSVKRNSRKPRWARRSSGGSPARRESVGSIEFERAVEAAAAVAAAECEGDDPLSPLRSRHNYHNRSRRRESFQFVDGTLADISPIGASGGGSRSEDDKGEIDQIEDGDFERRFARLGIRSGGGGGVGEGKDTAGARFLGEEARVLEDGCDERQAGDTKRVEHDSNGGGFLCEPSASPPPLQPSRDRVVIDLTSDGGDRFLMPSASLPLQSLERPIINLTRSNNDNEDKDRRRASTPYSPPRSQLPLPQRDNEDNDGYVSSSSSSSSSNPTRGLLVFPGTPTKTIPLSPATARIITTPAGGDGLKKHTLALTPSPTGKSTPSTAAFARKRVALSRALFEEFNNTAFEGRLPTDLEIAWSRRLNTTAGRCFQSRITQGERTARIELSTKVVDTLSKLRSTLAHELCHAAVWLLDTDTQKQKPHGPAFRAWGARVALAHPDINTTTCHAYAIAYKYTLALMGAGNQEGGENGVKVKKDGTPAKVNRYTLFVKENFGRLKGENPGMEVREVMRLVGKAFRAEQQAGAEGGGGN